MVVSVFVCSAALRAPRRVWVSGVALLVALSVGSFRPARDGELARRGASEAGRAPASATSEWAAVRGGGPFGRAWVFAAPRASAQGLPFTMESDVVMSPPLRRTVAELAQAFRASAGRSFHVTSGTRTPLGQARAMFDKLASGGRLTGLYRDYDAARQIEEAYRRTRRAGRGPCVAAMARVVSEQIARGLYISRHLHSGAVDIRSRDMSGRERRAFRSLVARRRGVRLLEEGRPPHFHLEFPVGER